MSRIYIDQVIPKITGMTYSEKEVNLTDYLAKPLILSFYRYAGCQLCNLRMNRFIQKYNEVYEPKGINALAVFQSPINKLDKNLYKHHTIPFDVISDPKMEWYKAFGVETSWSGVIKTGVKDFLTSTKEGYFNIDPDGPISRLPADFLISRQGKVEDAFYGKNIGDHIPFERIDNWILSK